MKNTSFSVVTRADLDPICPHCNQPFSEVYYKATGAGWFLFPRSAVFFCPHCHKVLGMGQGKMA